METIADAFRKEERLKREKIEKELREKIAHNEVEIEHKDKEIVKEKIALEQKDITIEQKEIEIKNKERTLCEIVRNMLKKDMSVQSIQEITGLSKERIEQLK